MTQTVYAPIMHFTDANGALLAGGSLTFYESGTTTLKAVYADSNSTSQLPNPTSLNARGEPINSSSDASPVFGSGLYDVELKEPSGASIWTARGIRLTAITPWADGLLQSPSASLGREVLGLGTAAIRSTGVIANTVPLLDSNAALPPVDGSQLRNIWPDNHLSGFHMRNAAGDLDHDILIGTGQLKDRLNQADLSLNSPLTKQINATWAAGNNQGGREPSSALSADTWYYVHVIAAQDGTGVDVLFSLSINSPVLPPGYIRNRRIGAILTDASSNIRRFFQYGDLFYWRTPTLDINVTDAGTTRIFRTVPVPPFARLTPAYFNLFQSAVKTYLSSNFVEDLAPSETAAPLSTLSILADSSAGDPSGAQAMVPIASSQLGYRTDVTGSTLRVSTLGYLDDREKDGPY